MIGNVVGWHIHPEAAKCACGKPATVVVQRLDDYDTEDFCNECLQEKVEVRSDKIEEVFRKIGF